MLMLLNGDPLISFVHTSPTISGWRCTTAETSAIQLSHRSTVSNSPLAVGDIAIERVGGLSHTAQEVADIAGCNTKPEVLRHPNRHLIIREIITKKLLEVVDVLSVPN